MLFKSGKDGNAAPEIDLRINGDLLEGTDCYNYLGVLLNASLNFKAHIDRSLNACNTYVFALAKIQRYITNTVAVQIYKSLVLSRLNYGGMLCLGAPKVSLSRLQKLQNRALRICLCVNRYTSNVQIHVLSKVLPLHLRRKLEIYRCMYKRMLPPVNANANTNGDRDELYTNSPRAYRAITRFSASRPPTFTRPHSVKFLNSITYQGPKLWADLPSHIKILNDVTKFNSEIHKLIQNEMQATEIL